MRPKRSRKSLKTPGRQLKLTDNNFFRLFSLKLKNEGVRVEHREYRVSGVKERFFEDPPGFGYSPPA